MISMTREPLLRNVMRCGLWIILWSWYFQICVECCGVFCFFYRYNDVIIYPQCLVCSLYLSTGGSKVRVSNRDSIQLITNLKKCFHLCKPRTHSDSNVSSVSWQVFTIQVNMFTSMCMMIHVGRWRGWWWRNSQERRLPSHRPLSDMAFQHL